MEPLFWATIAVAVPTFLLAVGTVLLAWSTRRGVQLQSDQLRLAKEQFEAAQRAARPQLEIDVSLDEQQPTAKWPISGTVRYVHGSEPAYDVEIWIKTRTQSFGTRVDRILTPSVPTYTFVLNAISDEMFKQWPFPEAHKAPVLQGKELWAGVTWRASDGTFLQRRYKQLEDGTRDEHPEAMEPYPVIEDSRFS